VFIKLFDCFLPLWDLPDIIACRCIQLDYVDVVYVILRVTGFLRGVLFRSTLLCLQGIAWIM